MELAVSVALLIAVVACSYKLGYDRGVEKMKNIQSMPNILGEVLMAVNAEPPYDQEADYIFIHECIEPGCETKVEFDDEPWCFTHSPDEGSSLRGYSARREAGQ